VEIVVEMLPLPAVLRVTSHTHVAYAVLANATDIPAGHIGQEDVGTKIDATSRALETTADHGERAKIDRRVDRHQHIGVFWDRLVGRQRADKRDPPDSRQRTCRTYKGEHGPEQVAPRIGHRGPRHNWRSLPFAFHTASSMREARGY
jgi:hypothetical protein